MRTMFSVGIDTDTGRQRAVQLHRHGSRSITSNDHADIIAHVILSDEWVDREIDGSSVVSALSSKLQSCNSAWLPAL